MANWNSPSQVFFGDDIFFGMQSLACSMKGSDPPSELVRSQGVRGEYPFFGPCFGNPPWKFARENKHTRWMHIITLLLSRFFLQFIWSLRQKRKKIKHVPKNSTFFWWTKDPQKNEKTFNISTQKPTVVILPTQTMHHYPRAGNPSPLPYHWHWFDPNRSMGPI